MRKKIFTTITIVLLLVLILLICVKFYYREQSFLKILPEIPDFEAEMVQIMSNDEKQSVSMSNELFNKFIDDMNEFKYQHISHAIGLDSFGRIVYLSNGRRIEIMFSNEHGGSVLINPIDKEGNEPIYKVIGYNNQLEEIFDTYVDRATGEALKETE